MGGNFLDSETEDILRSWESLFSIFESCSKLENSNTVEEIQRSLEEEDERLLEHGGFAVYSPKDSHGEIVLNYSGSLVDKGTLAEGLLMTQCQFSDDPVASIYSDMLENYQNEYLSFEFQDDYIFGEFSIPVNYDNKYVKESIEIGVIIINEAEELQLGLQKVVEEYREKVL